jgi:uncharacterized protein YjbI with pentapeptide repeats
MNIRIKSRTNHTLFEGDFSSLARCLEAALEARADLRHADLIDADLRHANLRPANLIYADLSGADLSGANLSYADLSGANLSGANLGGANLIYANLSGANLIDANLIDANLIYANLIYADLGRANLRGADLSGATLIDANLIGANLRGADLQHANLRGANLSGADLSKKELAAAYAERTILPEGDLIGYKKLAYGAICKVLIPAAAKRVGGMTGRKCRAEWVEVLEGEGVSSYDNGLKYAVGAVVRPSTPFDDDVRVECASGIHFFTTRTEAENY